MVKDGKAIKVEDIRFASVVDSAFWSAAELVFRDEILKIVDAHATFDLSAEIDEAVSEITRAIAKADLPGLQIKAGTPDIALDGVYVASSDLVVVANLTMPVDAEVTEAILK
ncbi:hypothetical protein ABIB95_008735 [Bradyrhizobium sp. LA2.1]